MKLKKLGKTYFVDSENNFSIDKDIVLSDKVLNYINIILDYIRASDIDIHSAYLRGSCLERNTVDSITQDIDILIVHKNNYLGEKYYLDDNSIQLLIDKMESLYGLSIYPDVNIFSRDYFLDQTQLRFLSKIIYGQEDLSILKRSKHEMIDYADSQYLNWMNKIVSRVRNDKKFFDEDMWIFVRIRSTIKNFFRKIALKFFIEDGQFTISLHQSYEKLLEKYPHHSEEFNDILELFLNIEEYSKEQIMKVLNKMIFVVGSIQSNKPYRIIVNMKTE